MMKKIILIFSLILSLFITSNAIAQTAQQFGFVNSIELLNAMPEKISATETLENLNKKYKEELKVMRNEYNKKYSDFVSYQTSMAENIRLRRMQELYELERQINDFMKIAQEDIDKQEKVLVESLQLRIKEAIRQVGTEKGLICIYDISNEGIAFVTPDAVDVNPFVRQKLGIKPVR